MNIKIENPCLACLHDGEQQLCLYCKLKPAYEAQLATLKAVVEWIKTHRQYAMQGYFISDEELQKIVGGK
jgi:hypothetical protein